MNIARFWLKENILLSIWKLKKNVYDYFLLERYENDMKSVYHFNLKKTCSVNKKINKHHYKTKRSFVSLIFKNEKQNLLLFI